MAEKQRTTNRNQIYTIMECVVENKQYSKKWETPLENCNQIRMGILMDDGTLSLQLTDISTPIDYRYKFVLEEFEAYKSTTEYYLFELWELRKEGIGFTFIVENSKWIEELMKDPIFQDHCTGVVHYVIATLDEGIEILAKRPPKISTL